MNSLLDELNAGVDDNDMVEALRKMTILVQKEQDLPAGTHLACRHMPTQADTNLKPSLN